MALSLRSQRGFSLAEILIAGVLLAGVTAGLLRAFTSTQSIISAQHTRSDQSDLVSEKLEMLYEGVRQDWWADSTKPLSSGVHDPGTILGNDLKYTVSPVDPNAAGGEDYRKVKITAAA